MKPEEIHKIVVDALRDPNSYPWGAILGTLVFVFLIQYLLAYSTEKGKNIATSQDIETLTKQVESVKQENAKELETLRKSYASEIEETKRAYAVQLEYVRSEYAKILSEYNYDIKAREQAAKVAEFLAMREEDGATISRRNQLSWELALWLPAELYQLMARTLCDKRPELKEIKELLIAVRQYLLRNREDKLTWDNIIQQNPPEKRVAVVAHHLPEKKAQQ